MAGDENNQQGTPEPSEGDSQSIDGARVPRPADAPQFMRPDWENDYSQGRAHSDIDPLIPASPAPGLPAQPPQFSPQHPSGAPNPLVPHNLAEPNPQSGGFPIYPASTRPFAEAYDQHWQQNNPPVPPTGFQQPPAAPPSPKKPNRTPLIVTLTVILVVAALFVIQSAYQKSRPRPMPTRNTSSTATRPTGWTTKTAQYPTSTYTPTQTSSTTTLPKNPVAIGTEVPFSNSQGRGTITASSVVWDNTVRTRIPGTKALAIKLTVTVEEGRFYATPTFQILVDREGKTYHYRYISSDKYRPEWGNTRYIYAGQKTEGYIFFEVPAGEYSLIVGTISSTSLAVFSIPA